ncbi:energy coupling factor transporter S component ThiW [Piscibacillus salipiscarius]|uniref:Energy coupling factor transporter S component ThiW n=1 Tax=Piscibacillus salipiscarius TaxID=299480 RepID=A0ABW5QBZ5_9BACI
MGQVRKLTVMSVFIAIGIVGSQFIWFPAGVAKAYPVQHAINVMAAISLGTGPAVLIAFLMALIRNLLGLGTLLAFPGGMIGAFFAGILYKRFKKKGWAAGGEIFGTGIIGALIAFPIANFLMGSSAGALFFIPVFIVSCVPGAIMGVLLTTRLNQHIIRAAGNIEEEVAK